MDRDAVLWTSEDSFEIVSTRFRVGYGPGAKAHPGEHLILKPRWMVEELFDLLSQVQPANIVELGIFRGGSAILMALFAPPRKLVAADLRDRTAGRLHAWIDEQDCRDRVRTFFGVDQADGEALARICDAEFDSPLDLVVDDASHLLEPTRASFNTLFGRLRPGGVYLIEDWASLHDLEREVLEDPALRAEITKRAADGEVQRPTEKPLTRLLFEVVLASAYTDLVGSIYIRRHWCAVTRGNGRAPRPLDISRTFGALGHVLLA